MKPKILYLVTTILSCGLFCACSNDYTDIEFGSVTVDRQVYLLFIGNSNLTVWSVFIQTGLTAWALNLGSAIKCPESSAL